MEDWVSYLINVFKLLLYARLWEYRGEKAMWSPQMLKYSNLLNSLRNS